ncbi:alpha/beta fold hydrolase [Hyunsoonleella flava]|uniref:Alpha/beta fold hydrolase n=1 Tax=Hyunsoonleella flava TaxID=2527939 RepID=A0A4V2JA17_9FLAO|nr:alpha/beta fold hydrolase [Hyunsoonleella flava]TBN01345.1 alpha/beta fold hydrolase [Hyunsoonleella flava]
MNNSILSKKQLFQLLIVLFLNTHFAFSQNERPQEPQLPLDYPSENVTFTNPKADNIKLSGTLTLPKDVKKPPVAVLISGSGPQNRDAFLKPFNHKPFLVLSDYLTKQGIAVLRYDDRGIAASEGDFKSATSFDFASDVAAAIAFLKKRQDIDISKIGLIGHSEGGLIAPIVASKNKDVAFAILLAGTGVDGGKILQTQSRKMLELRGTPPMMLDENEKLTTIIYGAIKNHKNIDTLKTVIRNGLNDFKAKNPMSVVAPSITPTLIEQQFKILDSKWLLEFIRIEPKDYLEKVSCPILVLNGSKDVQVLPEVNLPAIEKALATSGNKDVTIKELKGLNHLFQTADTGNIDEYKTIEETFSTDALELIVDWINERF